VAERDGRVVALAGAKGAGKSTTALALVRNGASLVSDDVAVLGEADGRVAVAVGAPRLRVRREVAESLGVSYDELTAMWVHEDERPAKRYAEVPVAAADGDGLVALDAVYVLGARDADAVSARRLTAVEALPRLMALRHLGDFAAPDAHARDFAALADVAERVPVFDLVRPDGVETIDQVVATVLGDVRSPA
jgi:ABC-type dipeptide/oligopeptide/nickel transport system ATPase component